MMATIPLFILEEHHEAFWIWHYAIRQKYFALGPNNLLHVDTHDDMKLPILHTPIHEASSSLEQLYRFIYNELGIASFIIPAAYQHIFQTIYWCKPRKTSGNTQQYYVRTYQQAGKFFLTGKSCAPWPHKKPWQDRNDFTLRHITLQDEVDVSGPVILDIDLDFFSCETFLRQQRRLEISTEEFQRFQNDKYHFLRLNYDCRAEELDGRCYIIFHRMPETTGDSPQKLSLDAIIEKIRTLMDFLERNHIHPVCIDVCRSRISGYTPEDQWESIEKHLITALQRMYDLETVSIHELARNYEFLASS